MGFDILVVDDDEEMLSMLGVILSEEGHAVRLALNADEAYRHARERAPDLVLMDLMLPLETGLAIAERLKSESCRDIPIIAMSASDSMLDSARARSCFDGWLPKPFSLATLLHYVAVAGEA